LGKRTCRACGDVTLLKELDLRETTTGIIPCPKCPWSHQHSNHRRAPFGLESLPPFVRVDGKCSARYAARVLSCRIYGAWTSNKTSCSNPDYSSCCEQFVISTGVKRSAVFSDIPQISSSHRESGHPLLRNPPWREISTSGYPLTYGPRRRQRVG
jgi:hypothetical protein